MSEYNFEGLDEPKYNFEGVDYNFEGLDVPPEQLVSPEVGFAINPTTQDVVRQTKAGINKALLEGADVLTSVGNGLLKAQDFLSSLTTPAFYEEQRKANYKEAFQKTKQFQDWIQGKKDAQPEAETVPGAIAGGTAQFLTGFAITRKAIPTSMIKNSLLKSFMAGAITDFSFFDPYEKRLSNLAVEHGIDNPVTRALQADENDPELLARTKQTLEGGLLGLGLEGVAKGVSRSIQAVKAIQRAKAEVGQANELLDKLQPVITDYRQKGLNQQEAFYKALDDAGLTEDQAFESALKTGRELEFNSARQFNIEAIEKSVKEADKEIRKGNILNLGADAAKGVDTLLGAVSTRIKNASPMLFYKVREFEFKTKVNTHNYLTQVQDFSVGMKKLYKDQPGLAYGIDQALFNQDFTKAKGLFKLIEHKGTKDAVINGFDNVPKVLDELYKLEQSVNPDVGYLKEYFPRNMKDYKKFAESRGLPVSDVEKALRDEANKLGRSLTQTEITDVVNKQLRSMTVPRLGIAKPDSLKARTIENVLPKDLPYYKRGYESLNEYIHHVTHHVEKRKFFGYDKANLDESIGAMLGDLVTKGELEAKDINTMHQILSARFGGGELAGSRTVQNLRNSFYAVTMNDPTNALSQLQDVGLVAYRNGVFRTINQTAVQVSRSLRRTSEYVRRRVGGELAPDVFRQEEVHIRDLGLDLPSEEFRSTTATARYVQGLFKVVGIKQMDTLTKNMHINASFDRWSKAVQSAEGVKSFTDKYGKAFAPNELQQVISDLRNKNITNNTKFVLFNELADLQPIALSEMPEWYLKHPNGRMLYVLKSFTLKQMDVLRNDAYNEIKQGNRIKGTKNLARYATLFTMAGLSTDQVKNWMLGKDDEEIPPQVISNLIKIAGLSDYAVKKGLNGRASDMVNSILLPPYAAGVDPIWSDLQHFGETGNSLKIIPFGKMTYMWFGGGIEQYHKRKARED